MVIPTMSQTPDGKVLYREFTLIDRNGNQVPARVEKRQ
jgi:hypothetical protein